MKEYIGNYTKNGNTHTYNTRTRNDIQIPNQRLELAKRKNLGITLFNSLPNSLKELPVKQFKIKLKNHLLANAYYNILDFNYFEN